MTNDQPEPTSSGMFPTTAWGLVHLAQDADRQTADRLQARNAFLTRYWKPVFCFLRAKGYPADRAEELTQDFFTRFLERDLLRAADPDRGRFRSYLLQHLVWFLSDQSPRRVPNQQRFERQVVTVSSLMKDEERSYEPPTDESPETVFMKKWAAELFKRVLRAVRERCVELDRAAWYDVFEAVHFADAADGHATQEALAGRFGMTRDEVRYRPQWVQRQFAERLEEAVREECGPDADVQAEVRELLALLGL